MLEIRADQRSITANLWPLTAQIYHAFNDHCDWWLFQIFFLLILFLFPKKFFWTILNLFSWNLETFTKHKEQICFLFMCSFFTRCCIVFCVLTLYTFSYFSTACKHIGWVCSLFAWCFAFTLCNNVLHLSYLDRFIK